MYWLHPHLCMKYGTKRKTSRPLTFDPLWGWISGQLTGHELFNVKVFTARSSGISVVPCLSLIAGTPTALLNKGRGGQRGVHLCRWSRSKQKSCIRLCLTGLLSCSEVSHSCPHHLATPLPVPESLHPLHLRGRRGKRRVWVNVRVMVDLDGFQKSTPYALVTEWIIQRYAGSRLICH